jgi:hypothetical protein
MPEELHPKHKAMGNNIWLRFNNAVGNGKKLNDVDVGGEVDALFAGSVHKYIKWQADFVATFGNYGGGIQGMASILDLIGKFEFDDAFNVWFGRMLVPSDRSNFSGPWFMAPWNYPGFYGPGAPQGPAQGPFGRNDGATVWGQFNGGLFKYYLSAFDLHDKGTSPLYSGRLNLSLINPEPGYYHSSTYYGAKDILAIGVGGQFKKKGSVAPAMMPAMPMPGMMPVLPAAADMDDLGAGVIDVEAAFYKVQGKYDTVKWHSYALASYLISQRVGWGMFQPLVRVQMAKDQGDKNWRLIDAQLGYVIDTYAARLALGFQNGDVGGVKSNAIFLGIQLQK